MDGAQVNDLLLALERIEELLIRTVTVLEKPKGGLVLFQLNEPKEQKPEGDKESGG